MKKSSSSILPFLIVLFFLLQTLPTFGTVYRVKVNGDDSKDGSSWPNALKTVQKALSVATIGDEIWVAKGTYYPDEGAGNTDNDQTSRFLIGDGVKLYGGFDGVTAGFASRNWVTHETILSGDLMQNDLANFSNYGDNSGTLVVANNCNNCRLDGFTIRGGNPSGAAGGIGLQECTGFVVENCVIDANRSSWGGGVGVNKSSTASFNNCTFTNNFSSLVGGGVSVSLVSNATFNECVFQGNEALQGGGVSINESVGNFYNCTFLGNLTTQAGPAAQVQNSNNDPNGSEGHFFNCTFSGNKNNGQNAIFLWNDAIFNMHNCIVWGNSGGIRKHSQFIGTTNVTYSIIQGGYAGTGNLNVDPLFVNPPALNQAPTTSGDVHLQPCSPAVDAGTNTNAPTDDLDGNSRPFNSTGAGSAITDMGAYEYSSVFPGPTANCQNVSRDLGVNSTVTVNANELDNGSTGCGPLSFLMNNLASEVYDCSDVPGKSVTLKVTDVYGKSSTCTANIAINDVTLPAISCPSNILQDNDAGNCSAVVNYSVPSGTDNCPGQSTAKTAGLGSGGTFPIGTTTETYTVTDASGNTASCSFTITVNDTAAPVAFCPPNIMQSNDPGNCDAIVNFPTPVLLSDNCVTPVQGSLNTLSNGLTNFSTVGGVMYFNIVVGAQQILLDGFSLKMKDAATNIGLNVYVKEGSFVGNEQNAAFWGNIAGDGQTTAAVSTGFNSIALNTPILLRANTQYAIALHEVGFKHVFSSGPFITATTFSNSDLTVNMGSSTNGLFSGIFLTPRVWNGTISYQLPQSGTLLSGMISGATFPVGMTTNTYEVQDPNGNTATCSFTVKVNDTEAPQITCPSATTQDNDQGNCSAVVTYTPPVGTDNCPGQTTQRTTGLGDGGTFPKGPTTETYVVTDAAGNTASCSFTVTINDTEAPKITCPGNITQVNDADNCSAVVTYTAPVGTDNCPGQTTLLTAGLGDGGTFAVGSHTETYTVTDASGNTASCSFMVTINDTEDPVIACPSGNVVRNTDPGQCSHTAQGADLDVGANDNCGVQSMINDVNQTNTLAGEIFSRGRTTVTWTATDIHGNTNTCTYDVRIRDREAPVFDNCPDDSTITIPYLAGGSYFTFPALTATDNCNSPNRLTITGFPLSGSFCATGVTTFNWTATDRSNNVGNCDFDITVVEQGAPAPGGWSNGGVGNAPSCATNWDANTGTLQIQANGGNVSGTTDNFCGINISNSSSAIDFRARVTPAGNSYSDQVGIMMRQSMASNSAHATMALTGTNVPLMIARFSAGAFPLSTSGASVSRPYWLRLYRFGGTITGYVSPDGVNWTTIMSYPNVLTSPLELVLFSTTSWSLGVSTFDNISINGTPLREGSESLNLASEMKVLASPNPFSTHLQVEINGLLQGRNYRLRLLNLLGQEVYKQETEASSATLSQRISLGQLPAGAYLLEVSAGDQREVLKVVKQ